MTFVIIIDVLVVSILTGVTLTKGLERALPFVAFVMVLFPSQSQIQVGLFGLTTQRVVLITLTILYFLAVGRSRSDSTLNFSDPLKWLMLLSVLWSFISTADSVVLLMSIKKLVSQVIEFYWLYYICTRVITDTKTIQKILYAIVASISVCSVFGMVEMATQWNVTSLFPYMASRFSYLGESAGATYEGRGYRIMTTFPHPILYGAALAVAILLGLYLAREAKGIRRTVLWLGILLMFYNIYKTSSRGPWLALALGLSMLFLLGDRRVRKYLLYVGMLTVAVLVIRPGVWDSLSVIYWNTFNPNTVTGSSYDYRYALEHVAVGAVTRSFPRALWGYGMESFYFLGLQGTLNGSPYTFLSCDSAWINFMVESGFVGLFLIALLLMTAAFVTWRNFRRIPEPDRYLSLILFVCIMMYYFMMISVDLYSYGQNGYIIWLLIAASVSYGRLKLAPQTVAERTELGGIPFVRAAAGRLQPVTHTPPAGVRRLIEP